MKNKISFLILMFLIIGGNAMADSLGGPNLGGTISFVPGNGGKIKDHQVIDYLKQKGGPYQNQSIEKDKHGTCIVTHGSNFDVGEYIDYKD